MLFKKWRDFVVLGVFLLLGTVSCSRFLHDKQKNQKPFELDMQGVQCLNKVPEVLSQYFTQKLDTTKLHDTTLCVDRALTEFLRSTRGSDYSSYQAVEVQRFFQKYIFKREISSQLAKEIMKLKTAMIGGTEEVITRAEFEKLRGLLKVFEVEMLRLYPHLGVYLLQEPINVTIQSQKNNLDQAIADLKVAVQNLLAGLHLAESEYSLPEVDLLLAEIEKFAGISDPQHPFVQWRRNLPTLEKLKTLLVGEAVEVRGQSEINEIWNLLIDVYRLGLQYQGGIHHLDWMTVENFPEFDAWVEDLFAVLNRGFALRNKGQIPFKRIDEILDEFYSRNIWIEPLKLTTAKVSYRQFIYRFLEGSNSDLMAVDVRHLIQLHREYKAFKLIQNVLSKVFATKARRPTTEVKAVLEYYSIKQDIKRLSPLSLRDQEYLANAWKEFRILVDDHAIRHWDQRGKVFVGTQRWEYWTYQELTRLNLLRIPTSMFMRAYGSKGSLTPIDDALTVNQIKLVFEEFQEFGDEMGLFDLRNTDSAGRSAREADMFTPSGNGDGRVQFVEMFDLFSVMFSGGLVGVSDFKLFAKTEKCLLEKSDYFHRPYMKMECASTAFQKYFTEIFPNLPMFGEYVKKLTPARWGEFYADLMVVSRICPDNEIGLETGDQRTMIVVFHYIENLFSVYDRNQNGRFDEREVELAFPRFNLFMTDVTKRRVQAASPTTYAALNAIGYDWSGMALDVFKFIVFNGRAPSSDDLLSFMAGDFWGTRDDLGEADRQNIVRVFATLKSEISSSNSVQCKVHRD